MSKRREHKSIYFLNWDKYTYVDIEKFRWQVKLLVLDGFYLFTFGKQMYNLVCTYVGTVPLWATAPHNHALFKNPNRPDIPRKT